MPKTLPDAARSLADDAYSFFEAGGRGSGMDSNTAIDTANDLAVGVRSLGHYFELYVQDVDKRLERHRGTEGHIIQENFDTELRDVRAEALDLVRAIARAFTDSAAAHDDPEDGEE